MVTQGWVGPKVLSGYGVDFEGGVSKNHFGRKTSHQLWRKTAVKKKHLHKDKVVHKLIFLHSFAEKYE